MSSDSKGEKERTVLTPVLEHLDVQLKGEQRIHIPVRYQAGALCPQCQKGILDYDGLLNLVCPVCGQAQGGCFT
jgi:hypothetical protein